MSRKHVKQYLMLLLAVGVIAVSLSGGGTFATFNAQVANKNNTFKTGTLYLHESATNTCTSESAQSNSNLNTSGTHLGDACDILFTGVPAGDTTVGLDMKNAGSLDGDGLHLALGNTADGFAQTGCNSSVDYQTVGTVAASNGFTTVSPGGLQNSVAQSDTISAIHLTSALGISLWNGATIELVNGSSQTETFTTTAIVSPTATTIPVTNPTTITPAAGFTGGNAVKYSPQFSGGGGNLCTDLRLEIVEVPTLGDLSSVTIDQTTGDTSAVAGSKCVYAGATNGTNGCDFTNATDLSTIPNYSTFDDLSLKSLAGTDPNTLTGLDAGTHRYIVLALILDPAADNSIQGLQATFDLVWNMNQFVS